MVERLAPEFLDNRRRETNHAALVGVHLHGEFLAAHPVLYWIMDDARALLSSLNDHHVPHLIIGAYAMAFHGYVRLTNDLDILLDPASDPVPALAAFGIADLFPVFPQESILRYGTAPNRIDLTNIIEGVSFSEAWPGRVQALLYGVPTHVIGLADLVANKLASGRIKDHLDGLRLLSVARRLTAEPAPCGLPAPSRSRGTSPSASSGRR